MSSTRVYTGSYKEIMPYSSETIENKLRALGILDDWDGEYLDNDKYFVSDTGVFEVYAKELDVGGFDHFEERSHGAVGFCTMFYDGGTHLKEVLQDYQNGKVGK